MTKLKGKLHVWALLAGAALPLNVYAQSFTGTDNFSSLSNWNTNPTSNGTPINSLPGQLEEVNNGSPQLDYVNSTSTGQGQDIWEWTPGAAPTADNWTMTLDVSNAVVTSSNTNAEIGFGIAETGNFLNNNLDYVLASFQGTQELRLNLTTNGGAATHSTDPISATSAVIELSYNASSGTLNALYSPSQTNPTFTSFLSINLAQTWNLQAGDSLSFFVIGSNDNQAITPSLDATDFEVIPEPSPLDLLISGGLFAMLSLSWRIVRAGLWA